MLPAYTRKERYIDGVIHGLGATGSVIGVAALLHAVIPARDALAILAAAIYGAGLIAMLWCSAAYNLAVRPDRKERIRRYDHASIFMMIAGTYTPFCLVAVAGPAGYRLLALVWLIAVAGMALKLLRPRRLERVSVILYLGLGWIGLPAINLLIAALRPSTLGLLGIGGLLYTAGVGFHLWKSLPYHNAIWHGFVLVAAGTHFAAVLTVLSG